MGGACCHAADADSPCDGVDVGISMKVEALEASASLSLGKGVGS